MRFEEIIRFNQRRLDENFELGFQENGSNDYKQVRFKRPEYQEVRGFWVNMAEEGEIGFCLIVPESDMIRTKTRGWYFRKGQLEPIIRMAAAMWDFEGMAAIQTGLELDDTVTLEELEAGKEPCIRPFAILPPKFMKSEYLKKYRIFHINRNGILILEELEQPGYTCGES